MKLVAMGISLDQLERKVDQMLSVCASLRGENESLRSHVAGLEADVLTLALAGDSSAKVAA